MKIGRLEIDYWRNVSWDWGFTQASERWPGWAWWLALGPFSICWRR